ncbi:MAG: PilN domain-containing protein [gamma proteobacterium symbiont of Lucinoma myriamae]|nr:PilN domain-containing protein [gamma proteobacterium symbiont of Lucinoma myriamae]MCU7820051.1 PilN domain-containing protein [gamma proteobacterium symbiont of Lucinoma myriamae]MCU7833235.1 PilN domain-containing protein [gamma proteobacterium symbiont of Lucinoma myriamae]
MARINLLNWREEKRKQIEQQFYGMLAGAAIIGAGVVFAVQLQLGAMIDYQTSRNNYLKTEIKKVEKAIAEIRALEKKKADLLARMNVIQELQGNRSDSVHMLDELVKVLPEGVHLTKFNQKKKSLTFNGVAQSNARVSAYMRNIERAEWLKNPNLKVIQSEKKGGSDGYSQFTITSQQASPNDKKKKGKKG